MLVSTKIILQYASKKVVKRDWRIVVIPDEDSSSASVMSLFQAIVDHTYDSAEPFTLAPENKDCAIQAQVGKAQDSQNFQNVPLTAPLSEVVASFDTYFKYFVQIELAPLKSSSSVDIPRPARNAFEVRESSFIL